MVEHFEEFHVVVDPCSQLVSDQPYPHNYSASSASHTHDSYIHHSARVPRPQEQPQPLLRPQYYQRPQQHQKGSFHPDGNHGMELVPYTTQRTFATASSFTPPLSQLLECPSPVSTCDTATVLPSRASTPTMSAFSLTQRDSFNTYSDYSDYGAVASPLQASQEITGGSSSQPDSPYSCISPTLLYSPSSFTPSSSRIAFPLATQDQTEVSHHPLSSQASRSASSLHLSKTFRHPKPNYNKSYKHFNALRYHVPHGHCNFASPEDLEAPRVLLAQKGAINGNENSGAQPAQVTEEELHETERRLRPFACGIDDCQRQYMGVKGLRTSLPRPGSHPHLLILLVYRTSLSAFR